MNEFSVMAIDRHRIKTDGKGVTTLVALSGCPLSCPYCINADLLQMEKLQRKMTSQELVEKLMIDHCYFLYTNGGVTFGGGEPLLQSKQIAEFAKICPKEWNITIETSLNVADEALQMLLSGRFSFIIDIKAMQPDIYSRYTRMENKRVLHNLSEIIKNIPKEQYVIKVPMIPDYSDVKDAQESVKLLCELGIPESNILIFEYKKF